ncbi:hypothetical protein B0T14DRAFT_254054 [Immersiella caudata]|uniref:C2H2-type domain-containing protein n=1 Tax=Immersiella caudata TaxID=314043 RepID=A0AA39WK38_9PEZI|nr:hypothetical protein B0T14DRAFT_254054 [Immersiella caudata]
MPTDYDPSLSQSLIDQVVHFAYQEHMVALEPDPRDISIDQYAPLSTLDLDLNETPPVPDAPVELGNMVELPSAGTHAPNINFGLNASMAATSAWAESSPSTSANLSIGSRTPSTSAESPGIKASKSGASSRSGQLGHQGPFQCPHPGCDETRPNRTKLSQHKRCHIKLLSCRHLGGSCDKIFSTGPELRRHQRHERGDVLMCRIPGCKRPNIRGGRKDNMKRHLKNAHKNL